jgi:hypothetical protein
MAEGHPRWPLAAAADGSNKTEIGNVPTLTLRTVQAPGDDVSQAEPEDKPPRHRAPEILTTLHQSPPACRKHVERLLACNALRTRRRRG